jgi:hypothetical protein
MVILLVAEEKFIVLAVRLAVAFAVRVIVVLFADETAPRYNEFEAKYTRYPAEIYVLTAEFVEVIIALAVLQVIVPPNGTNVKQLDVAFAVSTIAVEFTDDTVPSSDVLALLFARYILYPGET